MDSREWRRGLKLRTPSGGASEPIAANHSAARYLRAAFGAGAYFFTGLAALICAVWSLGMLDRSTILSREDVLAPNNNAYTARLQKWLPGGALSEIVYPADSNNWPAISSLEIREDGHLLSPAHALHADIAKIGEGRYSHWNRHLIFSTSDNSDPRSNGRVYRLFIRPNLYVLGLFMAGIVACGLICTLLFYRNQVRKHSVALGHRLHRLGAIVREILHKRSIVIAGEWFVIFILIYVETYFLFRFGLTPWVDGDGWAYVRLAEQLPAMGDWGLLPVVSAAAGDNCSSSELRSSIASCSPYVPDWRDLYVFLFRMPGYPLLILTCKWLAGVNWQTVLVAVQHFVAVVAAYVVFYVSSRISRSRVCGFLCALLFVFSHRMQYDRAILTDSLCTSAITILVCICVLMWDRRQLPSAFQLSVGGCCLALLFLIRETVLVVGLAALPLTTIMLLPARPLLARSARLATLYAPLCAAVIFVLTWSYARTGYFFVTTQPLSAGLYSAIRLEKAGTPVFSGDTVLDRVARQTLNSYDYAEAMEINRRLLLEYNLSGPEQASLMQNKYVEIWYDHPYEMIHLWLDNLKKWPYVFLVTDLIHIFPGYNGYCRAAVVWSYFCGVICPLFIVILGIFAKSIRALVPGVLALLAFALVPTIGYAALDIELRYLIFATAPLLLIFALFSRSVGLAVTRRSIRPE